MRVIRLAGRLLPMLTLVLTLLSACDRADQGKAEITPDSGDRPYQASLVVFGTLVEITISGASPEQAAASVRRIETVFQKRHHDWHPWQPGLLADINQAFSNGHCHPADKETLELIRLAKRISAQSRGAFNPAIGKLIALWGFHDDEPQAGRPPPAPQAISALLATHPQMSDVHIKDGKVCSDNPAVALDLGGIAKGQAVDVAMQMLADHGIHNAIVNAGGDLRVRGRVGKGSHARAWRVGVRHPVSGGVLAEIDASGDEAIFTSGNYERFNEYEGVRYAHIIDPASGWPVHDINSATVILNNGAAADAWATALVVAGTQAARTLATRAGLTQVLLVNEAGEIWVSKAMMPRLHLDADASKIHVF